VRDDSADLFALAVLFALINEPAGRPARLVLELVIGKRRGEHALARERERDAAGVDRYPEE